MVMPASQENSPGLAYFGSLKDAREFQAKQPQYHHYEVYRKLKPLSDADYKKFADAKWRREQRKFNKQRKQSCK